MADQEIEAVRSAFEEHARKHFGWDRFERDSEGTYRNANVRNAWYWLRMGHAAGRTDGVNPSDAGELEYLSWVPQARWTPEEIAAAKARAAEYADWFTGGVTRPDDETK